MRSLIAATLLTGLGLIAAVGCSPAKGAAATAKTPAPVSGPAPDRTHPVVVELFTSQGCSSCPPANALLAQLSNRPEVLALSFAVTYWDDLGWKDTFGSPQYTDRQSAYVKTLGGDGDYTPQIVVNGAADVVGSRRGAVESLIAKAGRPVGPNIQLTPSGASVAAGAWSGAPADVWLVRYDPRVIQVPVARGENGGRTLPHKNVVRALTHLGVWSGKPLAVSFGAAPAGLSTAVLVQRPGGQIVAAARD
jgi:hypothetical protein